MQRFKHCRLSTVDYVIASPELFVKTHNLYVDNFDQLLSCIQNPICVTFQFNQKSKTNPNTPSGKNKINNYKKTYEMET